MKYEDMSDFDVNRLVALSDGLIEWSEQWLDIPDRDENVFLVASKNSREILTKDYCNDPSDAWPIIVENKVSVYNNMGYESWEATCRGVVGRNKNPLRAAMICFLKMKDAQ